MQTKYSCVEKIHSAHFPHLYLLSDLCRHTIPFRQSLGTTSIHLFTAPLPEQGTVAPSFRRNSPAHIFQMTSSLQEPSLCLGMFSSILCCFFPFLDPGTNPSRVCFPNVLTQTACTANWRGICYLNYSGGHSELLKHSRDRQSPPFGRKISCTQTRAHFILN